MLCKLQSQYHFVAKSLNEEAQEAMCCTMKVFGTAITPIKWASDKEEEQNCQEKAWRFWDERIHQPSMCAWN